jgi:hypothetical protein
VNLVLFQMSARVGDFHGAAGAGVGAGVVAGAVVVVVVVVAVAGAVCAKAPPACSAAALTEASARRRIGRKISKAGRREVVSFILLKPSP